MKYGIYRISLSIGFFGASQEDEIDVTELYDEDEWSEMSNEEQDSVLREYMEDILSQYIEISYEEPS